MKKFLRWIATTTLAGAMLAGLTSCGGGGVSSSTGDQTGILNIGPTVGNLYAGVPFTFAITGGRAPYLVTSNEQTVIPLAAYRVEGHTLTVIPNNPGVVDPGGEPGEVPHRSVNLTVRDANGGTVIGVYQVLQNFLVGYSFLIEGLNPCATACSGTRSRITVRPTTNGLIQRNKQLRFSILGGQFSYVINEATGALGPEVIGTTDEQGLTSVLFEVPSNARTQFGKLRVTDVVTGVYRDIDFTILNTSGALTVTPTAIDLAGGTDAVCGSGIADVIVTGGQPPYTASTTQPNLIAIQPSSVTTNGGSFSLTIFAGSLPNCITDAGVVVLDSLGRTATVTINTTKGTTPAPVPLTVAPNTICLGDGASTPVLVSGGNTNKVSNVANPALVTVVPPFFSGTANTVTVNGVGVAPVGPGQGVTVVFYDGATQALLSVLRKTTCP